eukprot:SAG25_NODE_5359_length_668_cov_0.395431_1_plen_203_part_10
MTHRAQITCREVGARSTASAAVFACTTNTSLTGTTHHTRSRLAHIVDLLSIKTGAASTITARRANIAPLAARALRIRLSARRADLTHASSPSIANRTILARLTIRCRLRARSTLAAHSAIASPARSTRLARSHIFVRLSATSARSTGAVRARRANSTPQAARGVRVWLCARRTYLTHATRARHVSVRTVRMARSAWRARPAAS